MVKMFKDGFNFRIEFPAQESTLNGKNEHLLVSNEKLPVVILLGWFGCKDENLQKYSSIYQNLGCIILRYIVPIPIVSYRFDKLPKLAKNLLRFLHDRSLDEHPIIFHSFSNGGSLLYQYISLEMQKQNKILQIKGVIFDSAPGRRRFLGIYRAFHIVTGGSAWYNVPVTFFIASFFFIYSGLWPLIEALKDFKMPKTTELVFLDDEPYNWPQLLIYSKNDGFVLKEDIEIFARHREQKGIKVTRLCFENSKHVQHLIAHRKTYIDTVVDFTKTCLKENK